jgi:hypothetical protein
MGLTLLKAWSEGGLYLLHLKSFSVNKQHALTTFLCVKTSTAVWHSRLGHASQPIVSHLLQQFSLPVSGVKHLDGVCEPCQLGKCKQLPFQPSPRVSLCPLDLIHSDVWSCSTKSLGGCSYYVFFINDFSRFTWLYPIHNKSDVFQVFVQFKSLAQNQFSSSIKQFQCDGGGEYMSNQFKNFLVTHGIIHRVSCPHTPQQNGVAECKHRHIMEMGLFLLAQSHLSSIFWVDAFVTSVCIINRLPSSVLGDVSPFFKLFNKGPDYSLFRSFGCSCFPLLRHYSTHKLMFRSKHCIFLGYSSTQRGYRCLDPVSCKVYVSRHVVFYESRFPATKGVLSNSVPVDSVSIASFPAFPSFHSPSSVQITPVPSVVPPAMQDPHSPLLSAPFSSPQVDTSPSIESSDPLISPLSEASSALIPSHSMVTRSKTDTLRSRSFPDYTSFFSTKHLVCALTSVSIPIEPTCYSQAEKSPEWRAAMGDEFDTILANETWSLCPRPSQHNIIRNKWVYKINQKLDGSIDRYKARLVAKGFDQESGVDFT